MCQGCHNLNRTAKEPVVTSPVSSSAFDEDDGSESGPGEQIQQAVTLQWTPPSFLQSSIEHTYRRPRGKDKETSHINDGSSPRSVFLLYFAEIITLLVVETNRYYHDYIDLTMDPLLNLTLLKPKYLCFWH